MCRLIAFIAIVLHVVIVSHTGTASANDPTANYRSAGIGRSFGGHSVWPERDARTLETPKISIDSEPSGSQTRSPSTARALNTVPSSTDTRPIEHTAYADDLAIDASVIDASVIDASVIDASEISFDQSMQGIQTCCEARPIQLGNAISLNTPITSTLLDFQNRQTGKQLFVLESQRQSCSHPSFVVGAQFRASAMAAHTNTADRFPYLGRFPTDFENTHATDARLLQANQSIVAHASPWVSGYMETLYSDVFTFPTFEQGSWQVRQAYVVVGNLDETPFYAWLGKKTLDFGDFSTLNPFTQAVPWHYFAPLAEGGWSWLLGRSSSYHRRGREWRTWNSRRRFRRFRRP